MVSNYGARWSSKVSIHPDGWISGVYYVKIPKEVNVNSKVGWLELGKFPDDLIPNLKTKSDDIMAEEGKMILFPSYMWHNTVPLEKNEKRICIAFDVVKKR